MLMALEGLPGAGKSTLRDRLLADAGTQGIPLDHTGQFSWLSLAATRTLVRLRAGAPADDPEEAVEAACWDLTLHARFNLTPALSQGPVLADRLSLSTACLLALVHQRPVAEYVKRLAEQQRARPELTVLLTTDPALCQARLAGRETAPRFTDRPEATTRLADLYPQAATAWTRCTGLEVWQRPCTTKADLDQLAADSLAHLNGSTRPSAT
ncbi:AAA family ATPase [Kitasatospora sp. NBC_01287]|uniref:AAA family ATPase n=1 Tax=Kitasatospora sp. NBC_01287 TaxID=2903573 RepID=UPI002B1E1DEE|nr:AAA family ATPase [Kitasatospora sp. NBC_01287]